MWEQEALPQIRELCTDIRTRDYDEMSAVELGGLLDELVDDAGQAFKRTFGSFVGLVLAANALVDFCEQELGPEGGVHAVTMLQGFENESAASGAGLSRLAELAGTLPEVATAIRDSRFDDVRDAKNGEVFLGEMERYLTEYGWRAVTWGEVHLPTWAEEPSVPLNLIRRYLIDPEHSPATAQRRAIEQRHESIRHAESTLAATKLDELHKRLVNAQDHVPVSEGRALWQLISIGTLRIPLLSLGNKLAHAGVIDAAEDVFYLRLEELRELAAGSGPEEVRSTVSARRADLETWGRLIPPRSLGRQPPSGSVAPPLMRRFSGQGVDLSTEPRLVNGNPASRGTARGRARVIMTLKDAGRLESGDVLVCPSTAPPWTPLFAIAAAVVTDSGGMLSHSAIVAREYAIPCVVGTQVGTQKIPDGATITVDGSQGLVRIEDGPND
jgi:pyruvate,water dikinase